MWPPARSERRFWHQRASQLREFSDLLFLPARVILLRLYHYRPDVVSTLALFKPGHILDRAFSSRQDLSSSRFDTVQCLHVDIPCGRVVQWSKESVWVQRVTDSQLGTVVHGYQTGQESVRDRAVEIQSSSGCAPLPTRHQYGIGCGCALLTQSLQPRREQPAERDRDLHPCRQ